MVWVWKNSLPQLATPQQAPSELIRTTGHNTEVQQVPRISLTSNFQTLGVYLAPNRQQTCQNPSYMLRVSHIVLASHSVQFPQLKQLVPT
jgi:hypothetical protein